KQAVNSFRFIDDSYLDAVVQAQRRDITSPRSYNTRIPSVIVVVSKALPT
ncbi:MAG: hypothetical protein ACI8PT_004611, partial [Gammaproteobacteria bacterium]